MNDFMWKYEVQYERGKSFTLLNHLHNQRMNIRFIFLSGSLRSIVIFITSVHYELVDIKNLAGIGLKLIT